MAPRRARWRRSVRGAMRASEIGWVWSRERIRMIERAERSGCSRLRVSARSRVSGERAPWTGRGPSGALA